MNAVDGGSKVEEDSRWRRAVVREEVAEGSRWLLDWGKEKRRVRV